MLMPNVADKANERVQAAHLHNQAAFFSFNAAFEYKDEKDEKDVPTAKSSLHVKKTCSELKALHQHAGALQHKRGHEKVGPSAVLTMVKRAA